MNNALFVDAAHDLVQTFVYFSSRPREVHSVLCHFEARGSYATGIDSLTRRKQLLVLQKQVDSLSGASHVRDLGYAERLVVDQGASVVSVELVLGSARQRDVYLLLPRTFACGEGSFLELVSVRSHDVVARCAELQHIVDLLTRNASRIVDISVRTGDGNHLRTQLSSLRYGTPSHVAKA